MTYLRFPAAALMGIGGYVHLDLLQAGYRGIPKIGVMFWMNVIASLVIAIALLVTNNLLARLAGLGLSLATLAAFAVSRTVGLFNFKEVGLSPRPQALIALVVEIVAVLVLSASLLPFGRWRAEPTTS